MECAPLCSSTKKDIFIINFNTNCRGKLVIPFLSFDKWDKFVTLTSKNATCKKVIPNLLTNSFLNRYIQKFKGSNTRTTEYKPTKSPLWKRQVLGFNLGISNNVTLCMILAQIHSRTFYLEYWTRRKINTFKKKKRFLKPIWNCAIWDSRRLKFERK